jgi:two-component system nitrate/nitrite sensor histidine kinase NarX
VSQTSDNIYKKLRSTLLRWELVAIGLAMLIISMVAVRSTGRVISPKSQWVVYGSLVLLVGGLAASWVTRWQRLKRQLAVTALDLDLTRARMASAFRLSHRLARAQDEKAIIEQVMESCEEVVGVLGASFVPLDPNGQPHAALVRGNLPANLMQDWGEYLATAHAWEACVACKDHAADSSQPCPLMVGPYSSQTGVHCFPVRRGDIEYGMLNLYLPRGGNIEDEALTFLAAMLDEMAMAMEAVRLRDRSETASRSLEAYSKPNLGNVLHVLLETLTKSLNADWAYLSLNEKERDPLSGPLVIGNPPQSAAVMFQKMLNSLGKSSTPMVRDAVDDLEAQPPGVGKVILSPLCMPDEKIVGGVIIGFGSDRQLPEHALPLTQAISSQLAVTAHYARIVQTAEYQAVIGERTRLAREIHDGLAQTLGFLKLITTQMLGYLERGEIDRLASAVELCRTSLAEAYLDTRQAIDGLRISPDLGLEGWLVQAADDFAVDNDLQIEISSMEAPGSQPAEVQVQLVRIIQEALTNIRKHAQASRVTIGCRLEADAMVLEIADDGRGFEPRDVPSPLRHGLQGMRERAELINADLEFVSSSEQGTTIRLRMPLLMEEALA